jgi:hypothetical protein
MRNHLMIAILAVGSLVFAGSALGQTSKKPEAAAAKSMGDTPDLSGVWVSSGPRSLKGNVTPETDEADEFVYRHSPLPLQPWAEDKFNYNKDPRSPYTAGRNELNPSLANCSPQGPTIDWLFQSFPFEIIQSQKRVLLIFERDHEIRQVWTDGREHPKDYGHTWMGHSTGKWEGDTLVIDTVGLNEYTWLDHAGHVHSDALHLVERLQRVNPDSLVLTITFDDPKAFTEPWTARKRFKLMPNWNLEEDTICEDKLLGKPIPLR